MSVNSETETVKELEFAIANALSALGLDANCPHGNEFDAGELLGCVRGLTAEAGEARFHLLQTGVKPAGFDDFDSEQKKAWTKEFEHVMSATWGWDFSKSDGRPRIQ